MNDLQTQYSIKESRVKENHESLEELSRDKVICVKNSELSPLLVIVLSFFLDESKGYTFTEIVEKCQQKLGVETDIDFISLLKDFKRNGYLIEKRCKNFEISYLATDKTINLIKALSILKKR